MIKDVNMRFRLPDGSFSGAVLTDSRTKEMSIFAEDPLDVKRYDLSEDRYNNLMTQASVTKLIDLENYKKWAEFFNNENVVKKAIGKHYVDIVHFYLKDEFVNTPLGEAIVLEDLQVISVDKDTSPYFGLIVELSNDLLKEKTLGDEVEVISKTNKATTLKFIK